MSGRRTERVRAMMEGFMKLHNLGVTIPEIAVLYSVSEDTIYRCLQEIADTNGVKREDLLQSEKESKDKGGFEQAVKKLSSKEVVELSNRLLRNTNKLLETTKKRLEETLNGQQ